MPPIDYVPVIDEVQDALNANSKEPGTKKIKLENGTTFQAGIWHAGMPKEFLNHMKQAVHACKRKGLFSTYADVLKARAKVMKEYKKVVQNLKTAQENNGSAELIKSQTEDHGGHLNAGAEHKQEMVHAAEGFFSLYANLLSVKALVAWNKIMSRQIGVTPWMDLKGKPKSRSMRKQKSHYDCIKHHLLTVFSDDAAEKQKFYISNVLKKPGQVTV